LLSYSENARVGSAVFIGGPPEARRGEGARFQVDVESPDAKALPVASPSPGVTNAAGWRAEAKDLKRPAPAEVQQTDFEKRHASRFKGRTFDWMRFQQ